MRERHAGRQQRVSYCVAGRQALAGRELRLGACSPAGGAQRGQLVLGSTLLSQVPGHDVLARNTRGTVGGRRLSAGMRGKKEKKKKKALEATLHMNARVSRQARGGTRLSRLSAREEHLSQCIGAVLNTKLHHKSWKY